MSYEFKKMKLPENHNFDAEHMKFLETIDKGLTNTASPEEIQKLQKQINDMFIEIAKAGMRPLNGGGKRSPVEYELNRKWIQNFFRGKDTTPVMMELKQAGFENYMSTGDLESGGYLVPSLLQAEIANVVIEGGIARREMRYLPFGAAGNSRGLPVEKTGVSVAWVDEANPKPLTKIVLSKAIQTLKKLAAIAVITDELLEDSAVDLVAYLARKIGEAIAAEEDNQFFSGTAAPWTGILNNANVVCLSLAASVGPIDMKPEALLALTTAVPSTLTAGAKFYMHRTVWAAICARRADAVSANDTKGVYLVQQPSEGSPGSIWGFPVVLVEAMPSLTDLGYASEDDDCDPDLPFIIFGNLQKPAYTGIKRFKGQDPYRGKSRV
jgi:HK97 family phage major capsid protein